MGEGRPGGPTGTADRTRSTAEEADFTAALDAASDRMRVVELARTLQNRPMNMFIIGYPKPPDTARGDLGDADLRDQLQRARQRGLRPRVVLHDGAPAGAHHRPGDPRHAEQDDGADHAVDQRRRPRRQHARQHHGPGPQPRPRADRAERDQGPARIDAARLHAGRRARQPRGRQRGPADPRRRATSTSTSPVRRGQVHGQRLDVRRGGRSRAGGWARTAPAATATRASCATPARSRTASACWARRARRPARRVRPRARQLAARTSSARSTAHLWENWEGMRYFAARMTQIVAASTRRRSRTRPATRHRPDGPARLLPVAADRRASARTRTTAGRGHAAGLADPRSGAVRLLHPAGRVHGAADRARGDNDFGTVAQRLAIHGIQVEPQAGGVFVPLRQPLRGLIAPILDSEAVLPMIETAAARATASAGAPVGGTVPATLSLTLGAPATLRAVHAGRGQGVHREHHRQRDLHRR